VEKNLIFTPFFRAKTYHPRCLNDDFQFQCSNRAVLFDQKYGKVSCLQKFRHFWMIIRDYFLKVDQPKQQKLKNTAKICHLYF
jgi:hypothetical protein